MVKNSVIISVSCSRRQAQFLEEKNLSSSELFQESINEQINNFERFNSDNAQLVRKCDSLSQEIGILHQFIEQAGKFEEFRKWRGTYVLEKTK